MEYDSQKAAQGKAEGLQKVEAGASVDWMDTALALLFKVALKQQFLTADDVTKLIPAKCSTNDTRAMGAVLRRASARHWIEATDTTVASTRTTSHRGPRKLWRSRIYKG